MTHTSCHTSVSFHSWESRRLVRREGEGEVFGGVSQRIEKPTLRGSILRNLQLWARNAMFLLFASGGVSAGEKPVPPLDTKNKSPIEFLVTADSTLNSSDENSRGVVSLGPGFNIFVGDSAKSPLETENPLNDEKQRMQLEKQIYPNPEDVEEAYLRREKFIKEVANAIPESIADAQSPRKLVKWLILNMLQGQIAQKWGVRLTGNFDGLVTDIFAPGKNLALDCYAASDLVIGIIQKKFGKTPNIFPVVGYSHVWIGVLEEDGREFWTDANNPDVVWSTPYKYQKGYLKSTYAVETPQKNEGVLRIPDEMRQTLYVERTGIYLMENGYFREAYELFKQAAGLGLDYGGIWHNLGVSSLYQGYMDLAIEYFKKAIERNPYSYSTYLRIGEAYFKNGNGEASQIYADLVLQMLERGRALKNKPDFPGYWKLAQFCRVIGNERQEEEVLQLLRNSPVYASDSVFDAHLYVAWKFRETGGIQASREVLEKCFQTMNQDSPGRTFSFSFLQWKLLGDGFYDLLECWSKLEDFPGMESPQVRALNDTINQCYDTAEASK